MATIYRTSDRIKVKIDDIVLTLAPLNYHQKSRVQNLILEKGQMGALDSTKLAVKYALKDIEGVETLDGAKYKLEFGEDGLSDECLDDLFNLEQTMKLSSICMSLLNGVPKEFIDPMTNKPMEGVSYYKEKKGKGKKN